MSYLYPYPEKPKRRFRRAFFARVKLAILLFLIIIVCCYCKLIGPPEHDFSEDMELWTHDFNCGMTYELVADPNEEGEVEYRCATLDDRHIEFTVEWRMRQCQLGPNGPKMPYYEPASSTDFAHRLNEYWSREYGTLDITGKTDTEWYYEAALIAQEHIDTFRSYCGARLGVFWDPFMTFTLTENGEPLSQEMYDYYIDHFWTYFWHYPWEEHKPEASVTGSAVEPNLVTQPCP